MMALSQSLTTSIDLYMWDHSYFILDMVFYVFSYLKLTVDMFILEEIIPKTAEVYGMEHEQVIYFWNEFHHMDGPDHEIHYMTRGAGECCLVMAYSVYFAIAWTYAIMNIAEGADPCDFVHLGDYFLTIQILTWCMWTLTEIFYTYKKVEWEVVGPIHVIMCIIVLSFSISENTHYYEWVANGVCKL